MSENLFLGDTTYPHLPDVEQLQSRIAQLEADLADARKDQARYNWIQDWLGNRVTGTKEFFRAKTRSDFDTSIDAAIKEQQ